MDSIPNSATVKVLSLGLIGRVWYRVHKEGQRKPYAYGVRLDGGQEIEVGRDDLEVTL